MIQDQVRCNQIPSLWNPHRFVAMPLHPFLSLPYLLGIVSFPTKELSVFSLTCA